MNATLLDPNYSHEISQRFAANTFDTKTFALMNAPDTATGTATPRTWEWNVDFDGDGQREWPPQFNPVNAAGSQPEVFDPTSTSYRPENAYGPRDPFRPQLRRLLSTEYGDTKTIRHPMRLSINEFLDVEHKPSVAGSAFTSPLQYRSLTPHITTAPAAAFTSLPQPTAATTPGPFDPFYNLPPFPPAPYMTHSQDAVQEFWAQRDRQQMARDIYVMLYTFCGGNDAANVTTTSGFTVHSANVRRQMAQFAVNMVDALDRDDVITAFEFDNNLADGWDLDDDPSTLTAAETALLTAGERDVVYGVEAPQLTFSEVAWYRQPASADYAQTSFVETATNEFNFLQFELRSVHPQDVKLASTSSTTAATGIWRILRDDNGNGRFDNTATNIENAVVFQSGAPTMTPGQRLSLASSDSNGSGTASLFVDYTGSMTSYELVAPNPAAPPLLATYYDASTNPTPLNAADLDLLYAPQASWYILAGGGSPGDLLSQTNSPATNPEPVIPAGTKLGDNTTSLALERRLNPYLPTLSLAANPFVPVDRNRVTAMNLLDGSVTDQPTAAARLAVPGLRSSERPQPLRGDAPGPSSGAAPCPLQNTLGQDNSNSPATFNLLFQHYDRDFASVIELFDIPLTAPETITRHIIPSRRPASLAPSGGQLENGGPITFGGAVLLDTEDINHNGTLETEDANGNGILDPLEDGTNGLPANGRLDIEDVNNTTTLDSHPNHYHRLLSLVEVPTRTHRQLGDPLKVNRIPGKVNFNTIRDRHVLAALIDDREIVGTEEDANRNQVLDAGEDSNGDGILGLVDTTGAGDIVSDPTSTAMSPPDVPRDWWTLLLQARDGIDPITQLPLPITGASRPFRDLANLTARTAAPGLPSPLDDTILRRIPSSNPAADQRRLFELATRPEHTANPPTVPSGIRHRLLSKVIGNSTTRSNVFVVFATIGMFECYENPTTGAVRIGGQMDVDNDGSPDTHRAVFIIDRSAAEEAYDKGSGTFDWKKLVMARQRVN